MTLVTLCLIYGLLNGYKTYPGVEFFVNISRWCRVTILPIFLFVL